jgi:hypothetical protein
MGGVCKPSTHMLCCGEAVDLEALSGRRTSETPRMHNVSFPRPSYAYVLGGTIITNRDVGATQDAARS